ncbi:fatty acid desaturase family protein [Mycolicibacterium parafortuitum]|uniref:Acyl-CoA desaturase [Nocardia brasiliensis ATCC] n=1 Tax=Mycolicibacterium parafortuitum TaxID=39692 RepID=A0A375YG47_MYCPF|nr:acyl-CoA desaturase [Mycolicibacterium parafortuitum]ORB28815.1 acyl-CoA desaturase [Mycolicibacterium parafortuitum]SRX80082.1 acyl-CoA desaturase [Nocardia brasiliensis ATCC] [Mycolicibacterium parafortuitum]
MAIADLAAYTHLSREDIDALGRELDQVRRDIEGSLGERDAAYIRRTIAFQRVLEVVARGVIACSRSRAAVVAGTAALAFAKSVENMEIGHNVSHGQWDWMNDPEIHSATWEWDMVAVSSQWRYSHNYRHHVLTNVVGVDDDLGFGIMRMTRDEPWQPVHLLQPLRNILLAVIFEWGIALHGIHSERDRLLPDTVRLAEQRAELGRKIVRQVTKDYVLMPALSGKRWRRTLLANASANLGRNLWAYVVIFCGHFPDGAEKFTPDVIERDGRGDWYLHQILSAANFTAGRFLAFASGNLCYQIEHHLFPDLPSNRYAQIAVRVQEICARYGLPYTTGSLARQYFQTLRTIHKLALPDRFLTATSDDAPETASEKKFHDAPWAAPYSPASGRNSVR